MDISMRAAREEELDEAGELTARAYLDDGLLNFEEADGYLAELRAARQRAAHSEVLVAVEPGAPQQLLGAVAFVGDGGPYAEVAGPGEGEFRMLAVRREARGRGAGEALVRACIERGRQRGLARLAISSQRHMAAAHRLYGRLGFVRAPERDWEPIPGLLLWTFTRELSSDD